MENALCVRHLSRENLNQDIYSGSESDKFIV